MGIEAKKGYVYLRRRMQFCAAHRMHHPDVEDSVFGACANLHGHNYVVEVIVRGRVDPKTGFVLDLKKLKELMEKKIAKTLDHRNLDNDIPYFREKNLVQSAENICIFIWEQLVHEIPDGAELYCVRLHETENNMVEYYG
ncbi:MAG: 6-carboxytetrahydropterin synthase [Leptospiraceae bacterium]|nr:6-carboxytetrahydropterin synthase [Leptospiraceae bacterium]MDW8307281.1 6-carboxytetrahydropterin synthase [Leptospiraceae bacterium]